jgi:hypothetical protein
MRSRAAFTTARCHTLLYAPLLSACSMHVYNEHIEINPRHQFENRVTTYVRVTCN